MRSVQTANTNFNTDMKEDWGTDRQTDRTFPSAKPPDQEIKQFSSYSNTKGNSKPWQGGVATQGLSISLLWRSNLSAIQNANK
jgi:hypothetical protein